MAKANPKAWFPGGGIAKVYYRKVDRHAVSWAKHFPYFDSWREAHQHMLDKSAERLKRAEHELKLAKRFHGKVRVMVSPAPEGEGKSDGTE